MSDLTFEILRTAVRIARDEQIRRLVTLRARLAALYPNHPEERDAAIYEWAQHVAASRAVRH